MCQVRTGVIRQVCISTFWFFICNVFLCVIMYVCRYEIVCICMYVCMYAFGVKECICMYVCMYACMYADEEAGPRHDSGHIYVNK